MVAGWVAPSKGREERGGPAAASGKREMGRGRRRRPLSAVASAAKGKGREKEKEKRSFFKKRRKESLKKGGFLPCLGLQGSSFCLLVWGRD